MRNALEPKIKDIMRLASKLPYFTLDDILPVESNRGYLKVIFSRYSKLGKLIRLKKGFYMTRDYAEDLEKKGKISIFAEFISNIVYNPSYLSLEYVLYENNILTEIPVNFTLITLNKTKKFKNKFGNFFYHKIKKNLFCGFNTIHNNGFMTRKATKAKALFDFLYLRKNLITNIESFEELRLNLDNLNTDDLEEFEKYLKIERSRKMAEIFNFLKK